ncbi:ion transporter [Reichenbachiella ulvae]|uniref:Ion transporter n=1 Tax=Reichenbachiella ulvae TaxID=2980104 RepID=A0ABT3CY51_9BACT|nr:ion transporter [Reichenbachiella ulvae]MCV9388626.1 ion transporter [Reichenbachiella ulvae]
MQEKEQNNGSNLKPNSFQTLLLFLSIYVVIELYVSSVVDYTEQMATILEWIDFVICLLFLYDFFTGIYRAEDRWKYFRVHWIDLVSSIPMVGVLRAGRVFRIIRILRVVRSAKYILSFFNQRSSFNTFKNLIMVSVVIIMMFTLSFYHLERNANPHINDLGDSLWWTTITTITVGFLQDIPPVTVEGKFLSVALILLGMILFSTLTGTITDYFIEDEDIQESIYELKDKVDSLEAKIDRMNEKLDNLK